MSLHISAPVCFSEKFRRDELQKAGKEGVQGKVLCRWGYQWRLSARIFPTQNSLYFQVFLEFLGGEEEASWGTVTSVTPEVHFSLSLSVDDREVKKMESNTQFGSFRMNWGFPSFMKWADVKDIARGADTILTISTNITVIPAMHEPEKLLPSFEGSGEKGEKMKRRSGLGGLINLGSTCYLNSIIQSLFHLKSFRSTVFAVGRGGALAVLDAFAGVGAVQMLDDSKREGQRGIASGGSATDSNNNNNNNAGNDNSNNGNNASVGNSNVSMDMDMGMMASSSSGVEAASGKGSANEGEERGEGDIEQFIPFALQRLFFSMTMSDHAESTRMLITSFGWTSADAFQQHDATELLLLLVDRIADYCPSDLEGNNAVSRLLRFKVESFVRCLEVDFASVREDTSMMISLSPEHASLQNALNEYFQVEILEGDDKYLAEGHGLQVAEKGEKVTAAPIVWTFYLSRISMNFEVMQPQKYDGVFEFPTVLDTTTIPSLSHIPSRLELYAVLMHGGSPQYGHYYVYLRLFVDGEKKWFCFNDSEVSEVAEEVVMREAFGGIQASPNAYMLMYLNSDTYEEEASRPLGGEVPPLIRDTLAKSLLNEREVTQADAEKRFADCVTVVTNEALSNHPFEELNSIPFKNGGVVNMYIPKGETVSYAIEAAIRGGLCSSPNIRVWKLSLTQNGCVRPMELLYDSSGEIECTIDGGERLCKMGQGVHIIIEDTAAAPPSLKGDDMFIVVKAFVPRCGAWKAGCFLTNEGFTLQYIAEQIGVVEEGEGAFAAEQVGRGNFKSLMPNAPLHRAGCSEGDVLVLVPAAIAPRMNEEVLAWNQAVTVTFVQSKTAETISDPTVLIEYEAVRSFTVALPPGPPPPSEGLLALLTREGLEWDSNPFLRFLSLPVSPAVEKVKTWRSGRDETVITPGCAILFEPLPCQVEKARKLGEVVILDGASLRRLHFFADKDANLHEIVARMIGVEESRVCIAVMMGMRLAGIIPQNAPVEVAALDTMMEGAHFVCAQRPVLAEGEVEVFVALLPCIGPSPPVDSKLIPDALHTLCIVGAKKEATVMEVRSKAESMCRRKLGQAINVRDGAFGALRGNDERVGEMNGEEVLLGLQDGSNGYVAGRERKIKMQ
mmetsp:Transcript_25848/g.65386  ORF Transcript_25848/g.65386 Transcript_25848/m.65386 type:complete len:1125 (-) Transcript_25848:2620-5994(-)